MSERIPPLFAVVLVAVWSGPGVARAADPLPSLGDLLAEYRKHGLPLPPAGAKLVGYDTGWASADGEGNRLPDYRALAFEVRPATKTQTAILLRGTDHLEPEWDSRTREVKPDPAALKDLVVDAELDLVQAVQCHARGWDKLARFLLERSQKDAKTTPTQQLAEVAWAYWGGRITEPDTDRGPVAKRMKDLIAADARFATPSNRALLKSLELALVPGKGQPGTVEAAIDALVDLSTHTNTGAGYAEDERYARLVRMGFDAVPALIAHLDDDRLTRAVMQGFNNFRSRHVRVKDVAGDLLDGLAAEDLIRGANGKEVGGGWLRRQQGYPVLKSAAEAWWGKARLVGEEAHLLARVLPDRDPKGERGQVRTHLFTVIRAKYPKHIPTLYRRVLDDRPDIYSWDLAEAVTGSALPAEQKRDLLARGSRHKNLDHRRPALGQLAKLDPGQFTTILIATLEGLPEDVPGEYAWCPEAGFARLAIETDDPRVWQTLEKVVKRSALGLKMELLDGLGDPDDPRRRVERLRLLAQFLDDTTVRDEASSPKFSGPGAGSAYRRIEVRNFVAVEIARLLGSPVEENQKRTPEEWAVVRGRVREVLRRELDMK